MHGVVGTLCKADWVGCYERFDGRAITKKDEIRIAEAQEMYRIYAAPEIASNVSIGSLGCSLCSVSELLKHENIKSIKVSGRGRSADYIKMQITMSKKVIELYQKQQSYDVVRNVIRNALGEQYCVDRRYCMMR